MPGWMQVVANINPLSYMVNGLRVLMLTNTITGIGFDLLVLVLTALVMSVISAWMYPKVVI